MSLNLPTETTQYFEELVAEGHFESPEAAVSEAVRLLKLERLRAMVQEGIEQLDAGMSVDGKEVFAKLKRKHGWAD